MQDKPKMGPDSAPPCIFPLNGRLRAHDLVRRKLIRKMLARRDQHIAAAHPQLRRVP